MTCYHTDQIIRELRDLECPVEQLMKAHRLMSRCQMNTGLTYSSEKHRESVVIVGITTDASEFMSTLAHEIRHLMDDIVVISEYYDKENIAYLTGNIHKALYPKVHHLLCDECRNKDPHLDGKK